MTKFQIPITKFQIPKGEISIVKFQILINPNKFEDWKFLIYASGLKLDSGN
jgi:hypothetical protein